MSTNAYVAVAPDSTGKKIANTAVVLPVGTVVTNADGTTTTLTADTAVFVQTVSLTDPASGQAAQVVRGRLRVDAQDDTAAALKQLLAAMILAWGLDPADVAGLSTSL